MTLTFHLGEPFWRLVGCREVQARVQAPLTVAQALETLARAYPALAPDLAEAGGALAVVVEDVVVEPGRVLETDARLHLVWAASGG